MQSSRQTSQRNRTPANEVYYRKVFLKNHGYLDKINWTSTSQPTTMDENLKFDGLPISLETPWA